MVAWLHQFVFGPHTWSFHQLSFSELRLSSRITAPHYSRNSKITTLPACQQGYRTFLELEKHSFPYVPHPISVITTVPVLLSKISWLSLELSSSSFLKKKKKFVCDRNESDPGSDLEQEKWSVFGVELVLEDDMGWVGGGVSAVISCFHVGLHEVSFCKWCQAVEFYKLNMESGFKWIRGNLVGSFWPPINCRFKKIKNKEKCAQKELCLRPCWHAGAQIMELAQNTGCSSWCYADFSICRWHIRAVHEMGAGLSQNINVNLLFQLQNDAGLDLLRDLLWDVAKIHSHLSITDVDGRYLGTLEGGIQPVLLHWGHWSLVTGPFRPGVWKTGPWRPHSNLGFPTPGCFLPGEDRKPCWIVVLEDGSGKPSQY